MRTEYLGAVEQWSMHMSDAAPRHLFNPQPGDVLYHYTAAAGAEAILRSNALWLSEFSKTNDKTEYLYAREKFISAYQQREVWIEEIPRYMAAIKLATHEPATVMMIGAFAQDRDDLALWDRYADQARGCVVGIDAHWLATRAGVAIRRVCYDEANLRAFVNAGLSMLQAQYENEPENRSELEELASFFVMDLYAFKDPRFRSEAEVRISRLVVVDDAAEFGLCDPGGNRDDGRKVRALAINQRDGPYGSTRFIELPLRDSKTQTAIKSIGFGPKFDRDCEAAIRGALSETSTVQFWASDIPLR
jgi:hypothetical protein